MVGALCPGSELGGAPPVASEDSFSHEKRHHTSRTHFDEGYPLFRVRVFAICEADIFQFTIASLPTTSFMNVL